MCTLIALRRPGHPWPLLIAANRDEMADRPWLAPARHWPDRPDVVAGQDALAGGTWLGVNDHGVVAGVLNRRDSLGPDVNLRSRGELVLEALDHADALAAAEALAALDATAYRSFNLVIADNRDAYWLCGLGPAGGAVPLLEPVPEGLSMFTAGGRNDMGSPRVRRYLPQFENAPAPAPDQKDWQSWTRLLAQRAHDDGAPDGAMTIVSDGGFGTLSSSLIAMPPPGETHDPHWLFCHGRPGEAPYQPISLD